MPFVEAPGQPVDHEALATLATTMAATGVDGLVVLGLASEAWTLREAERDEILATVRRATDGRVPITVGIEGTTAVAVARAEAARAIGADGLMVLPPAAARSTELLVTHYAAVADASGLRILVQDSPQVTGVTLTLDALVALAEHPLVRSLKVEVPGSGGKVSAAHAAGIDIVAGWGGLGYVESVARGAIGCMPGCDLGPALLAIDHRLRAGDVSGADAAYRAIVPYLSTVSQSLDLLLLGAKHHLRRAGIFPNEALRAPARTLDTFERATLDRLLDRLAADGVPGFPSPAPASAVV
jgi:dihydrodipicolinate synthase/N-acetylneuraminate lyase